MIIADIYPLTELIFLTKDILSDLHNLSQLLNPQKELIPNPPIELIIAEKDPLDGWIELINSILLDLHKLSHIMAEGKDFNSDVELIEWNKKLKESRETDAKLNTFLSRHRSQSAPRGHSERGRSQSSDRRDQQSSRIMLTDEQERRSRRRLFQEDKETEDKSLGDKDKETEPEIEEKEPNLRRDRSPLKGKFAETGRKVMSKLRTLDLTDSKSESNQSVPPALPSLSSATPSLHSQMRILLPKSCSNEDQRESDEEMDSEEKKEDGSESVIDWLDNISEASEERHRRHQDLEENISQCAELIKDQNEKILGLKRQNYDINDELRETNERLAREEVNHDLTRTHYIAELSDTNERLAREISDHSRTRDQFSAEISDRDREIARLEQEALLARKDVSQLPELRKQLSEGLAARNEIEEMNVSLRSENQSLANQYQQSLAW